VRKVCSSCVGASKGAVSVAGRERIRGFDRRTFFIFGWIEDEFLFQSLRPDVLWHCHDTLLRCDLGPD
jgi:hypothetical protein